MPPREIARLARRSVIALLSRALGLSASRAIAQDGGSDDFQSFQPGQFSWHPDRSPKGPVAIIVSIPKQLTFVYRNGILIGVSTSSTGKPGHSTPTGVFTILQKAKTHTSAKYGEPMPDMQRLTLKGIALHVGDLPGYPDSHGCVHLPQDFTDDLFAITEIDTPVIIGGGHTDPAAVADPGPILGTTAKEEMEAKAGRKMFSPSTPMRSSRFSFPGPTRKFMCSRTPTLSPRARRSSKIHPNRSAPTCLFGRAAMRRVRPGRTWVSTPVRPRPPPRGPICSSASTARPR